MKNIFMKVLLLLGASGLSASAFGWSRSGHDPIAYIAELNLNPETKAIVEKYLDGKSIVYYASWPDQIRFIHEYQHSYSSFGHSAVYDSDCRHSPKADIPDAVVQISDIIAEYGNGKYKEMPDSVVAVTIKYLTHAVGDMHCPGHCKIEGRDNNMTVTCAGEKLRMHNFWDDMPARVHLWGYMEYGHQFCRLTKEQAAEICSGTVKDWGEEAARTSVVVWECAEEGGELDKPYINKFAPVMDELIVKAGYRLAYVLNNIFK